MSWLNLSAYGSLAVQFITGLIEADGLTVPLKEENLIVKDVLALELLVQSIEFVFYVYLVYLIVQGRMTTSVTSHRYLDWSITTPTMLISFVVFFKYLNQPNRKIRLFQSIREEQGNIIKLVLANALMLGLGYFAEQSIIPRYVGVTLGFIPFAYMFKVIYANYVKTSIVAQRLYYFSFLIWGLYGVAAVLPFTSKNIMYNILDVFAKNAYGLFLYGFILYSQKS
jgi:bacteriorhodopsin